ncbi:MAG: hypothetical protein LBC53_04800 [Spirochaetaceae bacterium]|nr:hypothetical protein [Spirochaetaceae bacterium]
MNTYILRKLRKTWANNAYRNISKIELLKKISFRKPNMAAMQDLRRQPLKTAKCGSFCKAKTKLTPQVSRRPTGYACGLRLLLPPYFARL